MEVFEGKMLDENIAIRRLQEHFRIHNDERPTPLLDEAELAAYKALSNQYWLRNMLIDYEKIQLQQNQKHL